MKRSNTQSQIFQNNSQKGRKPYKPWKKDAATPEGKSSLDIVLEWLTSGTNYARWRGDSSGITKDALASEIVARMVAEKITYRSNKDIQTKINDIQSAYNRARDWLANTGQGIKDAGEEGAEKTIHGNYHLIGL